MRTDIVQLELRVQYCEDDPQSPKSGHFPTSEEIKGGRNAAFVFAEGSVDPRCHVEVMRHVKRPTTEMKGLFKIMPDVPCTARQELEEELAKDDADFAIVGKLKLQVLEEQRTMARRLATFKDPAAR